MAKAERTATERSLDLFERLIAEWSVRSKVDGEGVHRLKFVNDQRSPAERVRANDLKEWWIVQYVLKHYRRMRCKGRAITAVKGPFDVGPDLHVKHGGDWSHAEVEVSWRDYTRHKHHLSEPFDTCRFLIVLSDQQPSGPAADDLPSEIIYIDREHFGEWFAKASADYAREHQPATKQHARLNIIAQGLQAEWVNVCPDRERSMATCPDCNACAYFGNGEFNEATLAFQKLAVVFAEKHCKRRTKDRGKRWDLGKVNQADLRRFVEACGAL